MPPVIEFNCKREREERPAACLVVSLLILSLLPSLVLYFMNNIKSMMIMEPIAKICSFYFNCKSETAESLRPQKLLLCPGAGFHLIPNNLCWTFGWGGFRGAGKVSPDEHL